MRRSFVLQVFGAALLCFLFATPSFGQLVGHWPLDEASGTSAADIAGLSLDGTVQGGAVWSPSGGALGGGLNLDGADDLVVVPDSGYLDLATGLTLSVWIRPSSPTGNRSLISKDGAYELDLNHVEDGSYSVRLNNVRQGRGTSVLAVDTWAHVAVTWDGSTVRYYYQGQPDGNTLMIGALSANTKDLGLGGRPASYVGGSPQFLVQGLLDDARIYDRALSDAEILAVYQNQPLPDVVDDGTPPSLSAGSPSGELDFGTTSVDMTVLTDESAQCRYDTVSGTDWSAMTSSFSVTGGTYHSESLTGLQNGGVYTYYIRCSDVSGNANTVDYVVDFSVAASEPPDLTAPVLSSPSPVGTVAAGTIAVNLTVSTDEGATCRYDTAAGVAFASMSNTFQITGGTLHETQISGLQNGDTSIFYVRCEDLSANANDEDLVVGFFVADAVSGFHPTDLDALELFVESRHGLGVATCNTQACKDAGDNVPLAQQYCDTDLFPHGCVRRWADQSGYAPPVAFEPPEWIEGRDHGQDDIDKPGVILDCLNGRPCIRGGMGESQYRGLEVEPNQPIGPIAGAFSTFVLAKPISQGDDFYYWGFAGTELGHDPVNNDLHLRVGFGSRIRLTDPGAVPPDQWHLIEVHRDAFGDLKAFVNGYDYTVGTPNTVSNAYFRFLMTSSRAAGMGGDFAAALMTSDELTAVERQDVRNYFATVYGLTLGDGGLPPEVVLEVPTDDLVASWSFDDGIADCLVGNGVAGAPDALPGPICPGGATEVAGYVSTALDFDGVDDYVVAGTDAALNSMTEITLSAWVRTTETTEYRSIIDKRDAGTDGFDLYLAPGGKSFMRVNNRALVGVSVVADGQWHHILGLYNGQTMRLYVDGVLDAGRSAGVQVMDTTAPTYVGKGYANGPNKFNGSLDQVRIYSRALTLTEIDALVSETEP